MYKRIAWGLVLASLSMTASADVFRWVDAQGRVHYSDRPEVENAVRVVGVSTHASDSAAIAARMQAESDQRAKLLPRKTSNALTKARLRPCRTMSRKTREEQCKEAKERYRVAIESQKLYRVGKDGERQYLTSQEIDEARLNSRKDMDTVCGQAAAN